MKFLLKKEKQRSYEEGYNDGYKKYDKELGKLLKTK